jgi:hypothetical protein
MHKGGRQTPHAAARAVVRRLRGVHAMSDDAQINFTLGLLALIIAPFVLLALHAVWRWARRRFSDDFIPYKAVVGGMFERVEQMNQAREKLRESQDFIYPNQESQQ